MALKRPYTLGMVSSQECYRLPFNRAANREEQTEGECYDLEAQLKNDAMGQIENNPSRVPDFEFQFWFEFYTLFLPFILPSLTAD